MSTKFANIDKIIWKLSTEIDCGCVSFEELFDKLIKNFEIYSIKRNRLETDPKYYRLVVKLKAPSVLVNAFHSSTFGYRAQYYSGEENGENANRYIIDRLSPFLIEKIRQINKSTCKLDWATKSLTSPDAKIWIHQGPWLRKNERKNRKLEVDRWTYHINDSNNKVAKKALWSKLVPYEEMLDIKGGFILLDGSQSKPNPKSDRPRQIYEYGFT